MPDTLAVAAKPANTSPATRPPEPTARTPAQYVPGEAVRSFLNAAPEPAAPVTTNQSDLAENFRHGGWMPFRRRVEQALITTPGISPRRLAAFRCCGCDAFVEARSRVVNCNTPSGPALFGQEYRVRATKCHDRFCVPCSQERSNRIRCSLLKHMHTRGNMKLITLTLAASDRPLHEILDRITKCFRLLRNKPLWKKNVKGGVSIIETKIGDGSGKWHVHFHIVAETSFIPQRELSHLWHKITGDSHIVDIRQVGARVGAVSYITKYITKAADHSIVMSPKHLSEAITAFHGRRLVSTFGTWRGLELMEKPSDDADYYFDPTDQCRYPKPDWRPLGSLATLLALAQAGDAAAAAVVRKLRRPAGRPPPKV